MLTLRGQLYVEDVLLTAWAAQRPVSKLGKVSKSGRIEIGNVPTFVLRPLGWVGFGRFALSFRQLARDEDYCLINTA